MVVRIRGLALRREPANISVARSIKFDLVFNTETAKMLVLYFPVTLVATLPIRSNETARVSCMAPTCPATKVLGVAHAARGCTSRSIVRPRSRRAFVRSCIA